MPLDTLRPHSLQLRPLRAIQELLLQVCEAHRCVDKVGVLLRNILGALSALRERQQADRLAIAFYTTPFAFHGPSVTQRKV